MNWHIGQRIVAVKDSRYGHFKQGDEFVIKGIIGVECHCRAKVLLDIGVRVSVDGVTYCNNCGWQGTTKSKVWWFDDRNFAPLTGDRGQHLGVGERSD